MIWMKRIAAPQICLRRMLIIPQKLISFSQSFITQHTPYSSLFQQIWIRSVLRIKNEHDFKHKDPTKHEGFPTLGQAGDAEHLKRRYTKHLYHFEQIQKKTA